MKNLVKNFLHLKICIIKFICYEIFIDQKTKFYFCLLIQINLSCIYDILYRLQKNHKFLFLLMVVNLNNYLIIFLTFSQYLIFKGSKCISFLHHHQKLFHGLQNSNQVPILQPSVQLVTLKVCIYYLNIYNQNVCNHKYELILDYFQQL